MYPRNLNGLFQQPPCRQLKPNTHHGAQRATPHATPRGGVLQRQQTQRGETQLSLWLRLQLQIQLLNLAESKGSGNVLHLLLNMAIEVVDLP